MLGMSMAAILFALAAGPVQFSGTASMYSEYGRVTGTGDPLVEPRAVRRMWLRVACPRPVNLETYD